MFEEMRKSGLSGLFVGRTYSVLYRNAYDRVGFVLMKYTFQTIFQSVLFILDLSRLWFAAAQYQNRCKKCHTFHSHYIIRLFPALGLHRDFHTVRGDKSRSYLRFGEMSDDIECLEIVSELVVFSDRDCEKKPVVFASVQCGRHRIYSEFFSQIESLA